LNLDTKISDKVSVFASAESLSVFNENIFSDIVNTNNRDVQVKGERLNIDKAYFDWRIYQDWLTFTAGRLPTTQGPPEHIKDGVSREGTYPVTGYSVPLDGYALTAKLSSPLQMKNDLSMRIIFTPGGAVNSEHPFRGADLGNPNKKGVVTTGQKLVSGMLEYEDKKSTNGLWEKMLAIMQVGYYQFASPKAYNLEGIQGYTDLNNYRITFDDVRNFDVTIFSPYLELNKVFKSQFDFYVTYAFSRSKSHAKVTATQITGIDPGTGTATPAGTTVDLGSVVHPGNATGTRLLTGTRYEFSNRLFLGAEYMKASEKATPTVFYTDSLFRPNYLNGSSYEAYILKNMYGDNFNIRLGFTHLDINSDLMTTGISFNKTSEKINVGSLSFSIKI
jgi:hypothetical protein